MSKKIDWQLWAPVIILGALLAIGLYSGLVQAASCADPGMPAKCYQLGVDSGKDVGCLTNASTRSDGSPLDPNDITETGIRITCGSDSWDVRTPSGKCELVYWEFPAGITPGVCDQVGWHTADPGGLKSVMSPSVPFTLLAKPLSPPNPPTPAP